MGKREDERSDRDEILLLSLGEVDLRYGKQGNILAKTS